VKDENFLNTTSKEREEVIKMDFEVEELEEVSPKHPCFYLGFAVILK